jgi:hypothetical protein
MAVKSLSLVVPDQVPYDRAESWFESFVGNQLLPIIERGVLRRNWFTRYGSVGGGKHILFRYEADDLASVAAEIKALEARFPAGPEGHTDYDVAGDIGQGEGSRFLGSNNRQQDRSRRGDVAFDFLHASASLFLDCLSGPDNQGYWQLERETTSGFSVETSLEQFHHLFCNMTAVPTFVVVASHPEVIGDQVLSRIQFADLVNKDRRWTMRYMGRVTF